MSLSECTIVRNSDGTYTITGTLQQIARIRRYQALTPSWQRRIGHLIDSVSQADDERSNVILFPAHTRHPAARP